MKNAIPEGYKTNSGLDPAEDYVGPFYFLQQEQGFACAFLPEAKNCNLNGDVHGGVLVTFADFALCVAATDNYSEESCTSISFNCEFVAAGRNGGISICKVTQFRFLRHHSFCSTIIFVNLWWI